MKVLFCSGFPISLDEDIKGGGNWIKNLINSLIDFEPRVEPLLVMIDPKVKQVEFDLYSKIPSARLPSFKNSIWKRLLFIRGWFDPYQNLVKDFKKVTEIFKPDIIQIFGYESQYIRLIGNTNIPIIIHFQGFKQAINFKEYNTKIHSRLSQSNSLKQIVIGNTYKNTEKTSAITSYLKDAKYVEVKYVLGRTDWDRWVTKVVSPYAKYFFCQEILRKEFFDHEWKIADYGTFRIFTVSKNSINKNIHLIIETVLLLEKFHPDFDFEWIIAGVKKSDYIPKYMNKNGKCSNRIKYLGNIGTNELVIKMLNSNLFVLPSAIENSPNALQEAMAIGMPVLSTFAGGVGSIIEHRKTGILVSEGEPYSLAGAILEIKNNPEIAIQMGQKARERALIRHDPELITKNLVLIYKEILNAQ
jgi:glycosyltransferase involved in cell wall biosynthesis